MDAIIKKNAIPAKNKYISNFVSLKVRKVLVNISLTGKKQEVYGVVWCSVPALSASPRGQMISRQLLNDELGEMKSANVWSVCCGLVVQNVRIQQHPSNDVHCHLLPHLNRLPLVAVET